MRTETYMRPDLRPVHASESSQISSGLTSNERMRAQESRKVRVNGAWDAELAKIRAGIRDEDKLKISKFNPSNLLVEYDKPKKSLVENLRDYVTKAKERVTNFFVKTADKIRTVFRKNKRIQRESPDIVQKNTQSQLSKRANNRLVREVPTQLKKVQASISSGEINRPKSRIEPVAPKIHRARRVNAERSAKLNSLPHTVKLQPVEGAPKPKQEPKPKEKGELLNAKPISKLEFPKPEQELKPKEKASDPNLELSQEREVSKSPKDKMRDLRPIRLYRVNLPPKKVEETAREASTETPKEVEEALDQAPIKSRRKNKRTSRHLEPYRVNLPRKTVEAVPEIVETVEAVPEIVEKTLEKPVALRPTRHEKKPQISRGTSKLVRRTVLGLLAGMALSPTVGSKIDTHTSSDRNTGGKHLVIGETPKNESKLDSPQRAQVSVDTNKGRTTVTFSNVEKKNSPKDTVLQPPVEHASPRAQVVVPTTEVPAPIVESAAAVPQTSPEPEVTQVAEVPPAPVPEAVSVAEAAPERAPEIVLTEPGQVTAELARQIMNNPNISVVRGEDGDRVWLSLQRLATNNGTTFKYDVDKIGIDEVLVQPQVLKIYLDLAEAGFQISLNSLTTSYEHSPAGQHPRGEAGDVGLPGNNNGAAYKWLKDRMSDLHIKQLLNEGNHLHWGVESGVEVEVRIPNPAA